MYMFSIILQQLALYIPHAVSQHAPVKFIIIKRKNTEVNKFTWYSNLSKFEVENIEFSN